MSQTNTLKVFNPSTNELIANLDTNSKDEALNKIVRAKIFFDKQREPDKTTQNNQRHLLRYERIDLLEKLTLLLIANKLDFLSVMVDEGGKPWADSVVEFERAIEGIKIAINTIRQQAGKVIGLGYQVSSHSHTAYTHSFPRGVVLAFSAFNHPLNLIVHQVIPAFAAGCPCIIKPAADTPLTCLKLVAAMHEVGIPIDYIQTVITDDVTTASAMAQSDDIAFFSFIGSADIGWMLRSKLKPGVRCALEHGGVAACIVCEETDIHLAAQSISKGGFYHAGQVCVSTQKIYVHQSIKDPFIASLIDCTIKLKIGNANDPLVNVGPLIRKTAVQRIHAWVNEAIDEGATLLTGGTPYNDHDHISGNYYTPTILLEPSATSKVSCQEVFGPVVCIYTYDDFNHVLSEINSKDFAFQAAIYTNNIAQINKAYDRIEASSIIINDHTAFRDDVMPFAGLKKSGLGTGGIPYTIDDMQYQKMRVIKN